MISIGKNANEIYRTDYPDIAWIVPKLLPSGMAILGGRPKAGKSWFTMQVSQAMGDKLLVLGQEVMKGKVLYFALEDDERRLKERMRIQGWSEKSRKNVDFVVLDEFREKVGYLHENNNSDRLYKMVEQGKYKLVIIDSFNIAFMGLPNIDSNTIVTKALKPLQKYSLNSNILTLIIDHHNKSSIGIGGSQNPIDNILGSTAKSSITDTAIGVYKQEKGKLRFMATGRDFEDIDIKLKADEKMCWQYDGDGKVTDKEQAVLNIFIANEGEIVKTIEIANELGIPESRASERISKLRQLEYLHKDGNGFIYVKNGRLH